MTHLWYINLPYACCSLVHAFYYLYILVFSYIIILNIITDVLYQYTTYEYYKYTIYIRGATDNKTHGSDHIMVLIHSLDHYLGG